MSRLCRAIETEKERGLREMERQRIKSVYVELVVVVGLIMTNSFKSRLSSHLRQVNLFASRMKEKRERESEHIGSIWTVALYLWTSVTFFHSAMKLGDVAVARYISNPIWLDMDAENEQIRCTRIDNKKWNWDKKSYFAGWTCCDITTYYACITPPVFVSLYFPSISSELNMLLRYTTATWASAVVVYTVLLDLSVLVSTYVVQVLSNSSLASNFRLTGVGFS